MCRLEDGRVGFAQGVVPGDLISVGKSQLKSGFVRALEYELVEPGPERVAPSCKVHGACGGCDFMQLSARGQDAAKLGLLREALLRTGGFQPAELPEPIELYSAARAGYRSRIQLQVDAAGRVGFFAARSHELVQVRECQVCEPALNDLLAVVTELAPKGVWVGFDRLELRCSAEAPVWVVRASAGSGPQRAKRAHAHAASKLTELLAGHGAELVLAGSLRDTELMQRWELTPGVFLAAPAGAFTQVNWPVNRALVAHVVEYAKQRGVRRFLDLYCGAGNFSLALAAEGISGVGVELSRAAISAAQQSMRALSEAAPGAGWVDFVVGDMASKAGVLSAIQAGERSKGSSATGKPAPLDLVLLDPPRSGARGVLPAVAATRAAHVCMCSCDPVTLARDLKQLRGLGFRLVALSAFDMFPETHHVEALAWLEREPAAASSER